MSEPWAELRRERDEATQQAQRERAAALAISKSCERIVDNCTMERDAANKRAEKAERDAKRTYSDGEKAVASARKERDALRAKLAKVERERDEATTLNRQYCDVAIARLDDLRAAREEVNAWKQNAAKSAYELVMVREEVKRLRALDLPFIPFPYEQKNTSGPLAVRLVNDVLRHTRPNQLSWGNDDNAAHAAVVESMRAAWAALAQSSTPTTEEK